MNNLKYLKMKWQPSVDLLAEDLGVPLGIILRFLPDGFEVFANNTGGESLLSPGIQLQGQLTGNDLNEIVGNGIFYRRIDSNQLHREVCAFMKKDGYSHSCGFSIEYCGELFGLFCLVDRKAINMSERNAKFLKYFKQILESDLENLPRKAESADLMGGKRGNYIHPERTPVLPLLDDLHKQHEVNMPEGVNLITRIHCPSDFSLYSDGTRIRQILTNFLTSAEHLTQKGTIKIECHLNMVKDQIAFSVSSTEIGIPVEEQDFSLTTSESQILAEKLGGEVYILSEKGKGSTFSLYLPIHYARVSA